MTATLPPVQPLQFALMYRKEAKPYERPRMGKTWGAAEDEGGERWGERDQLRCVSWDAWRRLVNIGDIAKWLKADGDSREGSG